MLLELRQSLEQVLTQSLLKLDRRLLKCLWNVRIKGKSLRLTFFWWCILKITCVSKARAAFITRVWKTDLALRSHSGRHLRCCNAPCSTKGWNEMGGCCSRAVLLVGCSSGVLRVRWVCLSAHCCSVLALPPVETIWLDICISLLLKWLWASGAGKNESSLLAGFYPRRTVARSRGTGAAFRLRKTLLH